MCNTQSLLAPGAPELSVPQTATVWAACAEGELIPGDPTMAGAALAAGKRWTKPTISGAGFDIILHDASDEGGPLATDWCIDVRVLCANF